MIKINSYADNYYENSGYELIELLESKSKLKKFLIGLAGLFSSSFIGMRVTYAKDNFQAAGNRTMNNTTVNHIKKVSKNFKSSISIHGLSEAKNGYNLNISAVVHALYVLISSLTNSGLSNKNVELTSKIQRIEKLLEKSFIINVKNIFFYMGIRGGIRSIFKSIFQNSKNNSNQEKNFKETLISNVAEESIFLAIDLAFIDLFTENKLIGLAKPISHKSKFEKIINYLKVNKIIIGLIGLAIILIFFGYLYKETIWEIYYSINQKKLNHLKNSTKTKELLQVDDIVNPFREITFLSESEMEKETAKVWFILKPEEQIILLEKGIAPELVKELYEMGIYPKHLFEYTYTKFAKKLFQSKAFEEAFGNKINLNILEKVIKELIKSKPFQAYIQKQGLKNTLHKQLEFAMLSPNFETYFQNLFKSKDFPMEEFIIFINELIEKVNNSRNN